MPNSRLFRTRSTIELNLVPLTDLVANVVGFTLFALLLALMSARQTSYSWFTPPGGSASDVGEDISGRGTGMPFNPIVTPTSKQRVAILCKGNRLYPLQLEELQNRLMAGFQLISYGAFPDFVKQLNSRRLDDGVMVASADAEMSESSDGFRSTRSFRSLVVSFAPLPGVHGDSPADLAHPASLLRQTLTTCDRNRKWICFFVEPDSIEVFKAARQECWKLNFQVGWEPILFMWPVRVNLLSSGPSSGFPIAPQIPVGKNQ